MRPLLFGEDGRFKERWQVANVRLNYVYLLDSWCKEFLAGSFPGPRILLSTIDNPGWSFVVPIPERLAGTTLKLHAQTADTGIDMADWYVIDVTEDEFGAVGDPARLPAFIELFVQSVYLPTVHGSRATQQDFLKWARSPRIMFRDELVPFVQWYADHCDGIWEHRYGMSLSLGEDVWRLSVELTDTELSDKPMPSSAFTRKHGGFKAIIEVDQQAGAFVGCAKVGYLNELLRVFNKFSSS